MWLQYYLSVYILYNTHKSSELLQWLVYALLNCTNNTEQYYIYININILNAPNRCDFDHSFYGMSGSILSIILGLKEYFRKHNTTSTPNLTKNLHWEWTLYDTYWLDTLCTCVWIAEAWSNFSLKRESHAFVKAHVAH